ncbi:hypothetical protein H310_10426 [Aphanomyces invadans]|uniref:FYVE-type domain-containing protein n=1 Tax=Aphanomyces invadans TaxID=157072 RepID=A0A024TSB1_9STRA|nr:hypothetical protein H310_10426 [Aphanomyces invadans]ETV96242.1 hypothetical protein H310_10426 [Aphanomyces invadans]|eukprot:XP_008875034.1 hypothetical protein H310_10426 [Aphanomyces invadans]
MTTGRRVSMVDGLDLVTMDRLLTSRVPCATPVACHLCAILLHMSPKKFCRLCGNVVCLECAEKLLVHGQRWTHGGLRTNANHPLTATVCLACFHHSFVHRVVGYVEAVPDNHNVRPLLSRRRDSPHMDTEDTVAAASSHFPPLAPLQRRVCVPIYGGSDKPCEETRPFRASVGQLVDRLDR